MFSKVNATVRRRPEKTRGARRCKRKEEFDGSSQSGSSRGSPLLQFAIPLPFKDRGTSYSGLAPSPLSGEEVKPARSRASTQRDFADPSTR